MLFLFDLTQLHMRYFNFPLVDHRFGPFIRVDFEAFKLKCFLAKSHHWSRMEGSSLMAVFRPDHSIPRNCKISMNADLTMRSNRLRNSERN